MVDIYRGQTKQNAKVEQIKIKLPVRLIIYGGAKSASDNSAFCMLQKTSSKIIGMTYLSNLILCRRE